MYGNLRDTPPDESTSFIFNASVPKLIGSQD